MYWSRPRTSLEHDALDPEFIYMPGYVVSGSPPCYALGGGLSRPSCSASPRAGWRRPPSRDRARAVFERGAARRWRGCSARSGPRGSPSPASSAPTCRRPRCWRWRSGCSRATPAGGRWRAAVALRPRHGPRGLRARRGAAARGAGGAALWWRARARSGRTRSPRTVARRARSPSWCCLPWGVRNHVRYGELFLTDSHGGHTALVGANPNTDGRLQPLAQPPVHARRPATAAVGAAPRVRSRGLRARQARGRPSSRDYALGLLAAKADRLLTHERALLYWPLYRQGVLRAARAGSSATAPGSSGWPTASGTRSSPRRSSGSSRRRARRNWPALALAAAAARARGALRALLLRGPLPPGDRRPPVPVRGRGSPGAGRRACATSGRRPTRATPGGDAGAGGGGAVAAIFVGWPRLSAAGAGCASTTAGPSASATSPGPTRLCDVRAAEPAPGQTPSPVRGVWDGFGLVLSGVARGGDA